MGEVGEVGMENLETDWLCVQTRERESVFFGAAGMADGGS